MARGTRKQVWGDAQESKKKRERERELPKKQCVGQVRRGGLQDRELVCGYGGGGQRGRGSRSRCVLPISQEGSEEGGALGLEVGGGLWVRGP